MHHSDWFNCKLNAQWVGRISRDGGCWEEEDKDARGHRTSKMNTLEMGSKPRGRK